MTRPSTVHDSFTIERVYPNCREHVWSAWSTPSKKAKWFGGGDHSMEFRVGGDERAAFRDEMGEHVNETRYFEIVEGGRIVLAYSMTSMDASTPCRSPPWYWPTKAAARA